MLISKKKHNRIMDHMVRVELKLLQEIETLEHHIAQMERFNTDDLTEHQINKYMNRMEVQSETT